MPEEDDELVPPLKVMRKRLNGVYSAQGFRAPTRRYVLLVALLVGLASVPTLAVITAGSKSLDEPATSGAMDVPLLPPLSAGPVLPLPPPSASSGSGSAPSVSSGLVPIPSATAREHSIKPRPARPGSIHRHSGSVGDSVRPAAPVRPARPAKPTRPDSGKGSGKPGAPHAGSHDGGSDGADSGDPGSGDPGWGDDDAGSGANSGSGKGDEAGEGDGKGKGDSSSGDWDTEGSQSWWPGGSGSAAWWPGGSGYKAWLDDSGTEDGSDDGWSQDPGDADTERPDGYKRCSRAGRHRDHPGRR